MNDRQRLEAIIKVIGQYLPPDGIPINDAMSEIIGLVDPLPPHCKPLTDEMVVTAARMLNERQADACGVDRDDQWAIYSDDFKADARAMLDAAHGIKE